MMTESKTQKTVSNKLRHEKLNDNASQITGSPQLGPISVGDMVGDVEVGG